MPLALRGVGGGRCQSLGNLLDHVHIAHFRNLHHDQQRRPQIQPEGQMAVMSTTFTFEFIEAANRHVRFVHTRARVHSNDCLTSRLSKTSSASSSKSVAKSSDTIFVPPLRVVEVPVVVALVVAVIPTPNAISFRVARARQDAALGNPRPTEKA
mmetsp:Transcript_9709/g.26462  ORF Transcript_9709/g.26462 Transcript_9709/m.26462 type:complete len:154 (-) Transcript_9709:378-839(-)